MSFLNKWKSKLEKQLDQPAGTNPFIDLLITLEKRTHLPRVYFVLAVIALCSLVFIVGYGAKFLANFIGFLYPAYASFKAIETPQKDDDTKWVTYWVVYAFFSVIFGFADIIVAWIPFYDLMKCCLFIWLMMPGENNGSILIYHKYVFPIFQRHETKIDAAIGKIKEKASSSAEAVSEITADLRDDASKVASQLTAEALAQAMTETEGAKDK